MIRAFVQLIAVSTLGSSALGAQAAQTPMNNGQYAAVIWNTSPCTVTIDRATQPVPANMSGVVALNHSLWDYVGPDGSMQQSSTRDIRTNGSLRMRVNAAAHLEMRVYRDCTLNVEQLSKDQLIANAEARVRYLEGKFSAERRSRIIGVALAAAAFGAAAHFSASDSEDAESYTAISIGAGLGSLLGTFSFSTVSDKDREDLDRDRKVLAELRSWY